MESYKEFFLNGTIWSHKKGLFKFKVIGLGLQLFYVLHEHVACMILFYTITFIDAQNLDKLKTNLNNLYDVKVM